MTTLYKKNTHGQIAQLTRWLLVDANVERLKHIDLPAQCALAGEDLGFVLKDSALISALDGLGIDRTELRAVAPKKTAEREKDIQTLAAAINRLYGELDIPVDPRIAELAGLA